MKLVRKSFMTRTETRGRQIESYLLAIAEDGNILFDLTKISTNMSECIKKELIQDTISYFNKYKNNGREVTC